MVHGGLPGVWERLSGWLADKVQEGLLMQIGHKFKDMGNKGKILILRKGLGVI